MIKINFLLILSLFLISCVYIPNQTDSQTSTDDNSTIIYSTDDVIINQEETSADIDEDVDNDVVDIKLNRIRTTFSKSYDDWSINLSKGNGRLETTFSSYDSWSVNIAGKSGSIRTTFSSFDSWSYGNIRIRTTFSSYDDWTISYNGKILRASTTFSGYDRWDIRGDKGSMVVNNTFSSYDDFTITDNMKNEDIELKMAAVFACLIGVIINETDLMKID